MPLKISHLHEQNHSYVWTRAEVVVFIIFCIIIYIAIQCFLVRIYVYYAPNSMQDYTHMYTDMNTHTHTPTHIHTHIHTRTHIHTHTQVVP